ncbi:MAG TPA: hypothetical protein VE224_14795 [Pseudolabrys sp.]|nr:hypothetical protein [Pseudolabrys sp.]
MPHKHQRSGAALLSAAILAALSMIGVHQAKAQQAAGLPGRPATLLPGIEILVTPYLWTPWTSVDVNPANPRLPSASNTIDPGKLISHLTWVPFMGEVEFRSGPYGLMTDYLHAPLKSGISTRNILFNGANAGLTIDTGTAVFLYRPIALPDQSLDIGAGVRAWGIDGDISLSPRFQRLPAVNVSHGGAWADPLLAARYHRELGNGFGLTGYADVGGFGAGADIDWQILATIDYAWRPGIDLHAGFRSLNFDIGAPRADFSVHMYGPIIAATFRF